MISETKAAGAEVVDGVVGKECVCEVCVRCVRIGFRVERRGGGYRTGGKERRWNETMIAIRGTRERDGACNSEARGRFDASVDGGGDGGGDGGVVWCVCEWGVDWMDACVKQTHCTTTKTTTIITLPTAPLSQRSNKATGSGASTNIPATPPPYMIPHPYPPHLTASHTSRSAVVACALTNAEANVPNFNRNSLNISAR